jgi:uncharacterized protein
MPVNLSPTGRAVVAGVAAAAALIGAFTLGTGSGNGSAAAGTTAAVTTAAAAGSRITVTGSGSATGTPDQLKLSMGVQTSASSVSNALAAANRAVRAVGHALRGTGVAAADIQTSGLSVYPHYSGSGQAPTGYDVSESIQVTLRNLATAGSQIGDAVRAGGNAATVDGVSLNIADTSSLLASARSSAVAAAKAKASQYASALGRPLGPVVTLSETTAPQPFPVFANGAAASSLHAAPVPVHPGTQQVSVTVTIVYALG